MLRAQAGVVREDDPGVDVESGVGERGGGLAVGVAGGPVPGGVRAQLGVRPAGLVQRVEHGGVFGRDDAVARVARGEGAGGVVGGGEGHLPDAEIGDARGRVGVAHDVPRVEEGGGLHASAPGSVSPSSA